MKITIENTAKIVEITEDGQTMLARLWQGETEAGVPVHCYVTRIVPEVGAGDPDYDAKHASFERELERMATPRTPIEAIPLRQIL